MTHRIPPMQLKGVVWHPYRNVIVTTDINYGMRVLLHLIHTLDRGQLTTRLYPYYPNAVSVNGVMFIADNESSSHVIDPLLFLPSSTLYVPSSDGTIITAVPLNASHTSQYGTHGWKSIGEIPHRYPITWDRNPQRTRLWSQQFADQEQQPFSVIFVPFHMGSPCFVSMPSCVASQLPRPETHTVILPS